MQVRNKNHAFIREEFLVDQIWN